MGLHLKPGLPDEDFVGLAIGNLAAFRLQRERREPLVWQVLRIEGSNSHHYRLVIRHPGRFLDFGIGRNLERILESLSNESLEGLRAVFESSQKDDGLKPVPLRHLSEDVDYWKDDFWNWFG